MMIKQLKEHFISKELFVSKLFFFAIVISLAFSNLGCSVEKNKDISIIPQAQKMTIESGEFVISSKIKIFIEPASKDIVGVADYLSDMLNRAGGFAFAAENYPDGENKSGANVILLSTVNADSLLGEEGYSLSVQKNKITIKALNPAGLFYGIQTLRQLLPVEIEGLASNNKDIEWTVSCVDIRDVPKYTWRGMHLDVSRHFLDKEYIKKYIDYMAMHKLNKFHWHLVDNQGWRIEIDGYPKLTEVGAYRPESRTNGIRSVVGKYDGVSHGGFYTKDDIIEIVAYAKSRFITVIPEIEMPGHSIAALAAYPEVSCTGVTYNVEKDYDTFNAGVPFKVAVDWRSYPDDFCAGKEETFEFLENILSEVIELFPSKYIHIGGDEARKVHWKTCPDCQKRMVDEGLENEEELQSYFIKRIEKFVVSKGRKIIGWDEILEGGIAPDATVMSWRGTEGGIEAAKLGHDVIMTPVSHCYFDHYQGEPDFEQFSIGGYLPLKKVYTFNPTPEGLTDAEAKHILGGQANMWTDHQVSEAEIEYMVFPRISALAEAVWSPLELRNWDDFSRRMEKQYQRYELMGINYSKSALNANPFSVKTDGLDNALMISFRTQFEIKSSNLEIRYTLDNSNPDYKSTLFTEPFKLEKTSVIKVGVFINNELAGDILSRKFIVNKAVNKPVELLHEPKKKSIIDGYDDLTNGMIGTGGHSSQVSSQGFKDVFNNGFWAQFEGDDFNAIVDLQKVTTIKKIAISFLQFTGAKSFMPISVEFAISSDGKTFEVVAKIMNDISEEEHEPTIKTFKYKLDDIKEARYIRVIAKNRGVIPSWHPRHAGRKAWLFTDEIIVE